MLFLEFLQVAKEQYIFFCLQVGVGIKDKGSCVSSQLHKLSVATKVGEMKVEGDAALLRAF